LTVGQAKKTRWIVGCGYLGLRVAMLWKQQGDRVIVTTRRMQRVTELQSAGFEVICWDITRPYQLDPLPPLDTLLMAVAFDPASGQTREAVCVDGLRHVLDAVRSLRDRLIFISTTGVYGGQDGGWVDEQSECQPDREAGRVYLSAERLIDGHRWRPQSVVLRMAGIYGPGRIPYLALLREGKPLIVTTEGYLNLIHVDDAVRVVAACDHCATPERFLVSDGFPVKRADYYREVARLAGTSVAFSEAEPDSPRGQRGRSNKRVCNRKLLQVLPLELQYPTYREGLRASMS
jgi:nucleoside-diphosphate-sugar epimerase